MAIVKLIGLTQQLAANGPVTISNAKAARELAPAAEHVHALNIESLLAVPLMDSGEQSGILILEQTSPGNGSKPTLWCLRPSPSRWCWR